MKIENITELFKTVMDDFNDQFASDFNAENIILQGISLNENYEKIFEEFCKKYFPHRLNDYYKTIEYYSFFASAFTGKTPYEKNGILVRTDKDISVKEMYHILYHELAHVYCVHKELDGKNFYDEYCENYAKDRVTDGQINAGYAVWRELISETIAIDCDEEYRRNFLIEKEKIISYYRSELGNKYGTLALSKLITEVLTSIDVVGAEEWEQAERVIMNSEFFDNPLLVEVFRVIFIQLRTKFLKIDIEFISELGLLCLEVIAYEGHSLKSRLEI